MQVEIFDGSASAGKGEKPPGRISPEQLRKIWTLRPGRRHDETTGNRIVAVAWALYRFWRARDLTEDKISQELGTTPGQVHHYLSIIKDLAPELRADLSANRLVFKEARCLADLDTWERQRAVGQLFVDDWLSSGQVETAVRIAKAYPEMSGRDVLRQVVLTGNVGDIRLNAIPVIPSESNPDLAADPLPAPRGPGRPPTGAELTPAQLQQEIVYAAGVIKCAANRRISYVERLQVSTALRQLRTAATELEAVLS